MALPWRTLDQVDTPEGVLELRRRGTRDFLITVGNRVLMNSANHRSEAALGALACRHLAGRPAPRVLVGGLGMGFTLRAVLDALPAAARVTVAELNPAVVGWCRGPLGEATAHAVADPRVTVALSDVATVIGGAVSGSRFDAILLDLYQGPCDSDHPFTHPLYGRRAVDAAGVALRSGGVLAVWGEDHCPGFAKRLKAAGFVVQCARPGRGGYRHWVYLGVVGGAKRGGNG
ncbi:MAG: hypothetical protein P1P84_23005 [Deferrisomatales bacterium]|nr:hypothetical protein [Deferrisomatales bacterium]